MKRGGGLEREKEIVWKIEGGGERDNLGISWKEI